MHASRKIPMIYQVGGPEVSDPRDCAVYLLEVGSLVLVDAGLGLAFDRVVENIASTGLDPAALEYIILTHCHVDHIGSAALFRERFGSKLVMHELDAALVEAGDNIMTAAFCFGIDFQPLPIDVKLYGEEGSLQVGDFELHWLHTPGHSAGSIAVYLDEGETRILFGQDISAPLLEDFKCDPRAWQRSMKKLLALDADILCEGHMGIIQPAKAVREFIERLIRLREREHRL